jgi:hypothetical protein
MKQDDSPLPRPSSPPQTPPAVFVHAWGAAAVLHDLGAFDAWLAAREQRLTVGSELSECEREAARAVAAALAGVVAGLVTHPDDVDAALDRLLDRAPPGDPGWVELLAGLRTLPASDKPLKVLALARYRRHLVRLGDVPEELRLSRPITSSPMALPGADLGRLVRGRALALGPDVPARFDLWLAGRRFALQARDGARVVDPAGVALPLREGRNLVGRAAYAEVVVDAALSDVSRRHLVVEVRDGQAVTLTDLSAHGTCVPRSLVDVAHAEEDPQG